jgi:Ca2+-binding EF-hand superfamily protein
MGHVPSAYYQTSIVFGAKALMVAGYLFAISLHLFSALHLFNEPSSTYWLLNMFLIHNIYVWCRVFYFFFGFVGVFKDTLYTNSIMTSGLILFPAVLGVAANMLFIGYVATSVLLYLIIVQPNEADRARFVSERTRNLLVNSTIHSQWLKEKTRLLNMATDCQLTDQQQAKQIFDLLDKNKNGYIDGEEINQLLKEWEASEAFMKRFFRYAKNDNITYDQFYKHIWRLSKIYIGHIQEGEKKENEAKARFVFDCLNTNADEYIDITELQKLLIQWGLPDNEVDAYLSDDDDKRFSFDEFYHNLKPIWDFAYENMTVKDVGQVVEPLHPHSN